MAFVVVVVFWVWFASFRLFVRLFICLFLLVVVDICLSA